MQRRTLYLFLVAVGFLLPVSLHAQAIDQDESESLQPLDQAKPANDKLNLAEVTDLIVKQTNNFRKGEDREPVEVNAKLRETAQYFADFMARTDKYGHTADGKRPADRAKEHDYDYCIVLENIANQYNSAGFTTQKLGNGFFQGWKHSPGHRRNMLDEDVTETGVAVARSKETGYYYAVQMFGRPKSQYREFKIANHSDTAVEYQIGDRTHPLPPRLIRTHRSCRQPKITFLWPGDEGEAKVVQPKNGDRFVVLKEDEKFRLQKNQESANDKK